MPARVSARWHCEGEPSPSRRALWPNPICACEPAVGSAGLTAVVEKACPSDCNAGFTLAGTDYFISCEPVSPGSVAREVMGNGVLYGRTVTVRRVRIGTNAGQVAVGPMADYCGPDTVAPGYYVVAPPVRGQRLRDPWKRQLRRRYRICSPDGIGIHS